MLRNQRQPSHPSKQQPQQQSQTQQRMQPDDILERTLHDYLACHPTYMIPLIRAHHFIFRDVGPLSMSLRHYIAIMAASRHRCSFLVTLSRKEFIASRGNPDWLKGLAFVPEKIRSLNEINKILSHQPWMLKPEHFESLTKPNMWTLSELTHAITIMAHVHSLCTLSFGCKFGFAKPENFDEEDADYEEVEIEEVRMSENGTQTIKKIVRRSPASKLIIERCKQLERENANFSQIFNFSLKQKDKRRSKSKQSTTQSPIVADTPPAHCDSPVGHSDENIITPGVVVASDAAGSDVEKQDAQPSESKSELDAAQFKENTWSADLWRKCNYNVFIEDADFSYVDFAKRGRPSDVSTFRFQDYQWDDQGYSLSNTLYPDVASFLDEKFKVGYNLTYYTLGPKTNIDTSPFRRAIWNYIQCIYGMRHDDYNYREVNILLERNLKGFIKVLGCYPEMVVKHDFSGVMQGFRASEKIHVIIMVTEARLQVEYLYALRALMEFMKMCS